MLTLSFGSAATLDFASITYIVLTPSLPSPKARMGIPKVWEKLSSILQDSHLSSFKGKKVALDFSILVHTATHAFTLAKQNTALMSTYGRMGEKSKTTEQRELEDQKREDEVRAQT